MFVLIVFKMSLIDSRASVLPICPLAINSLSCSIWEIIVLPFVHCCSAFSRIATNVEFKSALPCSYLFVRFWISWESCLSPDSTSWASAFSWAAISFTSSEIVWSRAAILSSAAWSVIWPFSIALRISFIFSITSLFWRSEFTIHSAIIWFNSLRVILPSLNSRIASLMRLETLSLPTVIVCSRLSIDSWIPSSLPSWSTICCIISIIFWYLCSAVSELLFKMSSIAWLYCEFSRWYCSNKLINCFLNLSWLASFNFCCSRISWSFSNNPT